MRRVALVLLLAAAPAWAQDASTVRVGNETKRTSGRVTEAVSGDVACYLTLKDDRGRQFEEMAGFDVCEQKPSIVGKRVALSYTEASVMSPECAGDMDCKKKVRKVIVSKARVLN